MGLKGYRLWVMGQLESNVQRPAARHHLQAVSLALALRVAQHHAQAVAAHKLTHLNAKFETRVSHSGTT
jgi:hypothetical protein